MLCDLTTFKNWLRLSDTTEDSYDALLLNTADRILKGWVKRDLENNNYSMTLSGEDQLELALRQRPVQAPVFSGTLTSGAATFTGMTCLTGYGTTTQGAAITGTSNLITGMPAAIVASSSINASLTTLPVLTNIASINSSNQVTLNNNATASGTFNIVFGLDVYLDPLGNYGDAFGAYAATTQQMLGNDYLLKRDNPFDGSSRKGLIQRMKGSITDAGWYGYGDWIPFGGSPTSSLTVSTLPRWPSGFGNIKVLWTAGVGVGATPPSTGTPNGGSLPVGTTIPFELTEAVCKIAAWIRLTTPRGAPMDTMNLQEATQQIAKQSVTDTMLGGVMDVIQKYRELSV